MNSSKQNLNAERPTPRFIRIKDVIARTGISRSYIYQLKSEAGFPQSVPLVPNGSAVGWVESEIEDWIDQRIEARDQEV
jgi:prophage regulatory protein